MTIIDFLSKYVILRAVGIEKITIMEMDDLDKKLLMLLQRDTKKTTKEYALALGLSVTAVYERIKKLEKSGVVGQYVALLDKKKIGRDFMVLCQVKLSQHSKEYILRFEKEVKQFPEILSCFHVSGEYDYILKICVEDMEQYREFMVNKLTTLQHIGSTQSTFVIKEVKESSVFELI